MKQPGLGIYYAQGSYGHQLQCIREVSSAESEEDVGGEGGPGGGEDVQLNAIDRTKLMFLGTWIS